MCWHKWTKWVTIEEGNLVGQRGQKTGVYIIQEKRCIKCNKIKLKEIESH